MEQIILTSEQNKLLNKLYEDDTIYRIVDSILNKYTWITDRDEYYSLANELLFTKILPTYNKSKGDGFKFVKFSLERKFKTEFTAMNRDKRCNYLRDCDGKKVMEKIEKSDGTIEIKAVKIPTLSLNTEDENGNLLLDSFDDGTDLISDIIGDVTTYTDAINEFISNLSKTQQKIAFLIMCGNDMEDIQEILQLSKNQIKQQFQRMNSFKNRQILIKTVKK